VNKFGITCVCLLVLAANSLYGKETSIEKKLDAILFELRQMNKLLETRPNIPKPPSAKSTRIEVGKVPFLGSKNAPFTLIEFTDYQCRFCQQFYDSTFKELKKLFIDTGKLRFYSMDLPLSEIHPDALLAAQAVHCSAEQDKFWPMYDKIKGNSKDLEATTLIGYAQGVGLNATAFRDCLESGRYKKEVEDSVLNAKAKGARGTPSFVIGKSTEFGVEGEMITGALPLDAFEKKLKDIGLNK
jgi:protein-disulfide isomerase